MALLASLAPVCGCGCIEDDEVPSWASCQACPRGLCSTCPWTISRRLLHHAAEIAEAHASELDSDLSPTLLSSPSPGALRESGSFGFPVAQKTPAALSPRKRSTSYTSVPPYKAAAQAPSQLSPRFRGMLASSAGFPQGNLASRLQASPTVCSPSSSSPSLRIRASGENSAIPHLDLSSSMLTPGSPGQGRALPRSARAPGSPTASALSTEPWVVCRICEQPVRLSIAEEHVAVCEKINKADMLHVAADEHIAEILGMMGEAVGRLGEDPHCMDAAIELSERCLRSDSTLELVRLCLQLRSAPRHCPRSSCLLDGLLASVHEKIAAIEEKADLRQNSPAALITRAPFFFRSPALHPAEHTAPLTPGRINRPRSASSAPTWMSPPASPKLALSIQDFVVVKPLTRGGYGSVYVARKVQTGDVFAVKAMSKAALGNKNAMATLRNERDILASTENPHVVKMYYCFASQDNVYIVMEYLPGGDCFSMLQTLGSLPEDRARVYAAETALALEYLHSKGVVHRDLKPDNMLVDKDGHIKLTDFGLSNKGLLRKQAKSGSISAAPRACAFSSAIDLSEDSGVQGRKSKSRMSLEGDQMHAVGTPDYIAPEVLLGLPHGEDVDWWALGCVLFELVVGVPPFSAETVEQTFDNITAKRLEWPDDVEASDGLKDCVDKLLELSPERRLGGGKPGELDLRSHRFFEGIDWEQLRDQRAPFVPAITDDVDTSFFDSRLQIFGQPPPLAGSGSASDERIPPADTFLWVNFGHLAEKTREALHQQQQQQQADGSAAQRGMVGLPLSQSFESELSPSVWSKVTGGQVSSVCGSSSGSSALTLAPTLGLSRTALTNAIDVSGCKEVSVGVTLGPEQETPECSPVAGLVWFAAMLDDQQTPSFTSLRTGRTERSVAIPEASEKLYLMWNLVNTRGRFFLDNLDVHCLRQRAHFTKLLLVQVFQLYYTVLSHSLKSEFHPQGVQLEPCAPYLALLGDTGLLCPGPHLDAYSAFLARCSGLWARVFVVVGNHEFYGCQVAEACEALARVLRALPNVALLERGRADLDNGFSLLGATLWSLVPPQRAEIVERSLNDYRCVRVGDRALSVVDTNAWHVETVQWLEGQLAECARQGRRAVVLTHHAPLPDSNPHYAGDPINCAFETDLSRLIRSPPLVAWFWGHTHCSVKADVGGVLVQSNQHGYKDGVDCGFDPRFSFPLA
eukprot:m51a1_g4504 putative protein kinase domain containing protein (1201) ;mRNA; f:371786-380544